MFNGLLRESKLVEELSNDEARYLVIGQLERLDLPKFRDVPWGYYCGDLNEFKGTAAPLQPDASNTFALECGNGATR